MAADGSVIIDTRINTDGITQGINKVQKQIGSLGSAAKKLALAIGGAFAVGEIVQFGKEALELGSDLQEVQNVVDVTFTTLSKRVDEFAKSAAVSAGLSETMAKKYIGTFGAMSKSFGFTESQAYDMSTALTQLSGDVASFYNLSQDEAYTKLKAVFTGETESLKELGVVMTQSALDSFALANGFGKTTQAMTEQEKVALRYQFVMQQLSAASGDFVRTSDGWANQVKVMQLQIESLKATIGQGLINLFTPVIQVINVVLGKLATVANAFKAFTELITGKKASSGGSSGSVVKELSDGYSSAASNAEDYSQATQDAAKATKDAAKAARQYLSPLDEINKYTSESAASSGVSGGTGGAGAGTAAIGGSAIDYGELAQGETVIEELDEKFQRLFDTLRASLVPLTEELKQFAGIASSGLSWLLENVLKPLANFTISEVLPRFFETLAHFVSILNSVLIAIQPLWQWFWDNVLQPIARWAADAFLDAWDSINELLGIFAQWCEDNPDTIRNATLIVGGFFAAWKVTELMSFIQQSGGVISAISNITKALIGSMIAKLADKAETIILTAMYAKDFVAAVAAGTLELIKQAAQFVINTAAKLANAAAQVALTAATVAWNGVCAIATTVTTGLGAAFAFLTSPIGLVILAISAVIAIGVLLYQNWDELCAWAGEIWGEIKNIVGTIADELVTWLSNAWTNIKNTTLFLFNLVKTVVSGIWIGLKTTVVNIATGIKDGVVNAFNLVKTKVSDAVTAVKTKVYTIFTNIKTKLTSITTWLKTTFTNAWSAAWTGAKDLFSNAFNGLVDIAKTPLNAIIGFINSMLDGIETGLNWIVDKANSLSFSLPDWMGGATFGINLPHVEIGSIPLLATGAVIPPNAPFMAMLGDQKHGTNLEAPEGLIRQIFREETQNNGGSYRFTAQINRRVLFDEMVDEAKMRQSKTGKNPFDLATT